MNQIAPISASRSEVIDVLRNSLYPGAKPESVELVLAYCRVNGIDPMLKAVHIVPTRVKDASGKWTWRDVLMPGIADYRIKAARSGEYVGKSEPEFGPDVERVFRITDDDGSVQQIQVTYPLWCRVTVKRLIGGTHVAEFPAREFWTENYATVGKSDVPNTMWRKRAYGQLAKVAEAQALRMAFPEFSSGYTAEEMEGKTEYTGVMLDSEPAPRPARTMGEEIGDGIPALEAPPPPPPPNPLATLRQRAATCATVDDVIRLGDAWSKTAAKAEASGRPLPMQTVSDGNDILADRMAELQPGTPPAQQEEDDGWPGPKTGGDGDLGIPA